MKQSKSELKGKIIDDQIKGSWNSLTENKNLQTAEAIGKPIAFSIRSFPFMRKEMGADSFSWKMWLGAFLWQRLFVYFMVGENDPMILINPFITFDIPSAFLSLVSYTSLILGFIYKFNDWFQFSFLGKDIDIYNRGESLLLYYEIEGDSMFNKDYFRQVFFEPGVVALVGLSLWLTNFSLLLGAYFLIGAAFYFIDEFIYHRAKSVKFQESRVSIRKGKKAIKDHEEMDLNNEEDDIYDLS